MALSDNGPRIGVVIPVCRQPALADEAIASVLAADPEGRTIAIAVVNDGCPFPETERRLRAWHALRPAQVHVVTRSNGGLSAARNAGVRLLMAAYPSIEAFFLLDADNLLEPTALAVFERAMRRAPDAAWFYPEFDMFGIHDHGAGCPDYSLLTHSWDNLCEAGSLVRRHVFEAGVAFDEDMHLGYEDWEFFLSAAQRGFRGSPLGASVFRYRKRPASMLSGARVHDAEIRSHIRRKHRWLYNARTALALEAAEAPRYRVLFVDDGMVRVSTDPGGRASEIALHELAAELRGWLARPGAHGCGAVWIATTRATWAVLAESGLLHFALWRLETSLCEGRLAGIVLEPGSDTLGLRDAPRRRGARLVASALRPFRLPSGWRRRAHLLAVSFETVADMLRAPRRDRLGAILFGGQPKGACIGHRIILPPIIATAPAPARGVARGLHDTVRSLLTRPAVRQARAWRCDWRHQWLPGQDRLCEVARKTAEAGPLYPALTRPGGPIRVCFLLQIADFGGVEMAAAGIAGAMRRAGFHTALCVAGTQDNRLARAQPEAFDEWLWCPNLEPESYAEPFYEGTQLPRQPSEGIARHIVGLLANFDAVIACHAAALMPVLAALRRAGVFTISHEHVLETGEFGRHYGPPILALAYEGSLDLVLSCSAAMRDWLRAHGIPESKLVVAPNAPGFALPEPARRAGFDARAAGRDERPLRVLFVGRFDWQKGMDRLAAIMTQCAGERLRIDWRVVGKAVVDEAGTAHEGIERFARLEPPVYDDEARAALFGWADVLLMPSRFEGLPLTLLEAQRSGVVPIVTRVGAVEEAATDGVNAVVVSQDSCVADMAAALARLDADRGTLAAMAEAAFASARSWDESAKDLIAQIRHARAERDVAEAAIWR